MLRCFQTTVLLGENRCFLCFLDSVKMHQNTLNVHVPSLYETVRRSQKITRSTEVRVFTAERWPQCHPSIPAPSLLSSLLVLSLYFTSYRFTTELTGAVCRSCQAAACMSFRIPFHDNPAVHTSILLWIKYESPTLFKNTIRFSFFSTLAKRTRCVCSSK